MEGLLLLLFLFIAFSKGKKKPKKPVSKPDPEARKKAQKAAAAHNEQLRRQLGIQDIFPAYHPPLEEEKYVSAEGVGQTEVYRGSLNAQSNEGECACDPSLEHEREAYSDPDSVYATEIGDAAKLDFSPQGIMQGVVMSEVLKRPAQRFRH